MYYVLKRLRVFQSNTPCNTIFTSEAGLLAFMAMMDLHHNRTKIVQ